MGMKPYQEALAPYLRTTQYYETDRMGIIHNSNYLRYFEEARVALLARLGYPYGKMEEAGVMLPVLTSFCEYKQPVGFGEQIAIYMEPYGYNGLRLAIRYQLTREDTLCAVGETTHCFVDAKAFRPIRLTRRYPELHALFLGLAGPEESNV